MVQNVAIANARPQTPSFNPPSGKRVLEVRDCVMECAGEILTLSSKHQPPLPSRKQVLEVRDCVMEVADEILRSRSVSSLLKNTAMVSLFDIIWLMLYKSAAPNLIPNPSARIPKP